MNNESGIYPIRDLILVKPDNEVEHKRGLIIIPEGASERERMAQVLGTVIALGPTCYKFEEKNYDVVMGVNAGDRVQFAKYQGIVLTGKDGISYRMIRDDDIMAKVDADVRKEVEV